MAFAKILSRNDDHRAREIDSDCRVKWCWGWLEKEITLNYGGTDLATTVGEFCRKIESCGISRCVLCDDNASRSAWVSSLGGSPEDIPAILTLYSIY